MSASKNNTKLTTVRLNKELYKEAKYRFLDSNGLNLQKLVNFCLYLFTNDDKFYNKLNENIESYELLVSSATGSI